MDLNTSTLAPTPHHLTRRNSSYVLQSCPRCCRSTSSSSLPSRVRGNVAMGAGSLRSGTVGRLGGGGRLALSRSVFSLGRLHTVRQACLFHSRSLGGGLGGRGDDGGGGFLGLRRTNEEGRGVLVGDEEDENEVRLQEDGEQEVEGARSEVKEGLINNYNEDSFLGMKPQRKAITDSLKKT